MFFLFCSSGGLLAYSDSQSESKTPIVEHDNRKSQKKKVVVLGTGWAATSFLKDLDISSYDVQVISPRNYFAFTPLLPSVTCGTVEARSIVEPVRKIIKKVNHALKVVNSFVLIFLISGNIAVRMYWLPIFFPISC